MSELILQCPHCEREKTPKLYINVEMGVFNCFRCGFKGKIRHLYKHPNIIARIEEQVSLAEYNKLKSFKPLEVKNVDVLEDMNPVREVFYEDPQYDYLISRGWTEDLIDLYRPLVSMNPHHANRVILPVVVNDQIVYYTARSMEENPVLKYKNPKVSRKSIVFRSLIPEGMLYPKDAVIGEGIFDMYKVPNGIGLLGKTISKENEKNLLESLVPKQNIYVCLDEGAEEPIQTICKKLTTWFPTKSIFYIDTEKYAGKDLGELSKSLTSIELFTWIRQNSKPYTSTTLTDSIKSKIMHLVR